MGLKGEVCTGLLLPAGLKEERLEHAGNLEVVQLAMARGNRTRSQALFSWTALVRSIQLIAANDAQKDITLIWREMRLDLNLVP